MILDLSDAESRYYDAPPARDLHGSDADMLARIRRATVADFDRAGVMVDFREDEAAFALLALWNVNPIDLDNDVADLLQSAAEARFEAVRDAVYADLDAVAGVA